VIGDGHLVSTDVLHGRLGAPGVRVVDVRYSLDDPEWGRLAFEAGHVPGAVYLHWLDDLSDPEDPVDGQLAPPERFRATMEAAGIGDETLVVAYDDGVIFMAARLAWCLHSYGHDRVGILDGGLPAWVREGRPLEPGPSEPVEPARFTPWPVPGLRATKADVLEAVSAGDAVLLDCRMDATWDAAGQHIPGARRLPAPSLVDADGRLRPPEAVSELASAAGAKPGDRVILYCGGGVSASLAFAALKQAGYEQLVVYDGSWTEWGADPATPKADHGPRS
jgi:thiosulfate/3-mercaptopyruvate sulfurtransferase